jgi:threonine dehydrogenase-like Zn-dependent dehydrogenase
MIIYLWQRQLRIGILPLTDVMSTGHHAAVSAGVRDGSIVAVVGDGAVGLCGVLAAKRLGATRIINVMMCRGGMPRWIAEKPLK